MAAVVLVASAHFDAVLTAAVTITSVDTSDIDFRIVNSVLDSLRLLNNGGRKNTNARRCPPLLMAQ
jgi:hypothetical protein